MANKHILLAEFLGGKIIRLENKQPEGVWVWRRAEQAVPFPPPRPVVRVKPRQRHRVCGRAGVGVKALVGRNPSA